MLRYATIACLFCFISCTQAIKIKNEADEASTKCDSILKAFKKVDEDLSMQKKRLDSMNISIKDTGKINL